MRRRSISTATALAVLFGSAALAVGAAGPATADSARILPVKSVGDMVVDGVHQLVYVSDPTSGKIIVTDYSGTVRTTLADEPGVTGLALSADSSQLYAAVKGDNRIVTVDTQTATPTVSYPLGTDVAPSDLEVVDGRIWFSYGDDFGSLDISGAEPVIHLDQRGDAGFTGSGTVLAADPSVPGVLAAADGGRLAVYDVTADGATLRTKGSKDSFAKQIDLTPDGKQVLTSWAEGGGYGVGAYSATDLAQQSNYPTDPYPNAVRIAPDGSVAGGSSSWYWPDVHIFRPGDPKPVREFEFPNTGNSSGGDTLVDGALAWAPDSSRIFAVSQNDGGVYTLRALTDPAKELPTLTVAAPTKADLAKKLTVTGKLTSTKTALPAGTSLSVTRTDLDSPSGKALPAVKTKADGSFSFTDIPPAGGKVTYKVSFAGDTTHTAASGSDAVEVSRNATTLSLNNNGKLYSYGADVKFTAHLGTTYKNRTVEIWANPFGGDKPNKLIRTATVNSSGNISATVDMTRDTDVTAVFKGDARYQPKTVKVTAYAKVKVSTAVTKNYKKAAIGSHTYYWFHKNTSPVVTTTMTYYPGRKQSLELEVYYAGKWYEVDGSPAYFALAANGKSAVSLGAAGESGIKARVRAAYINGSSGDTVNSTTYSDWKYIYFSN
ncbi:YncE family protein [Streptomyces sp. NPDC001401]|uniref:YncE family protein n=1 Tax=Streptomyces sp. NPDC001401 TaxID=3364570 RepID=UPI0036AACF95